MDIHEKIAQRAQEFIKTNKLEGALKIRNDFVQQMIGELDRRGELTERQTQALKRIEERVNEEKNEIKIATPTGRVTFEGKIISAKWKDSGYGETLKITVKVKNENEAWLCWGTCPQKLLSTVDYEEQLVGRTVKLTAELSRGSDKYFAFMKRPTYHA